MILRTGMAFFFLLVSFFFCFFLFDFAFFFFFFGTRLLTLRNLRYVATRLTMYANLGQTLGSGMARSPVNLSR